MLRVSVKSDKSVLGNTGKWNNRLALPMVFGRENKILPERKTEKLVSFALSFSHCKMCPSVIMTGPNCRAWSGVVTDLGMILTEW